MKFVFGPLSCSFLFELKLLGLKVVFEDGLIAWRDLDRALRLVEGLCSPTGPFTLLVLFKLALKLCSVFSSFSGIDTS